MADASHTWGADLSVSATGDISAVSGITEGQQRILRRLLTNPGEYLWQPDYGAGLPAWVGLPIDVPAITAIIRTQIYQEAVVSQTPEPDITVQTIANGIFVSIVYTDAPSGQTATLSFDVTK